MQDWASIPAQEIAALHLNLRSARSAYPPRPLAHLYTTDATTRVQVTDEEFSFIPVGGPMPCRDQAITAFGAAANLVHPATGYSITRMLEESGPLADSMAATLQRQRPVHESAAQVWDALWPQEKRRQVRSLLVVGLTRTFCVTGVASRLHLSGKTVAARLLACQVFAGGIRLGDTARFRNRARHPKWHAAVLALRLFPTTHAWVQASFHIFGMELLATLDVQSMHEFFETFFTLPDRFWRGFLASKLSSVDLMTFASLMFVKCSMGIRGKLMQHLLTNPAGRYLLRTYTKELRGKLPGGDGGKIERNSE